MTSTIFVIIIFQYVEYLATLERQRRFIANCVKYGHYCKELCKYDFVYGTQK
jgi:hypothetical protein